MKEIEERFNVSRETSEKLQKFVSLLIKWNKSINLISKSTEDDIWNRHVLDSMQILDLVMGKKVLDIGTGGGFPGVVISIAGVKSVTLVEKNAKKCSFLQQVKYETDGDFEIINQPIEAVEGKNFDVITCRGFASIKKILELSEKFLTSNVELVLLKGESYEEELAEAEGNSWEFSKKIIPSITNSSATNAKGAVLILSNVRRNG